MAVIHIDYNEGDIDSYRGIIVSFSMSQLVRMPPQSKFSTGDAVYDFQSALAAFKPITSEIMLSSSVDHFTQDSDGALYWNMHPHLGDVFVWEKDHLLTQDWHKLPAGSKLDAILHMHLKRTLAPPRYSTELTAVMAVLPITAGYELDNLDVQNLNSLGDFSVVDHWNARVGADTIGDFQTGKTIEEATTRAIIRYLETLYK